MSATNQAAQNNTNAAPNSTAAVTPETPAAPALAAVPAADPVVATAQIEKPASTPAAAPAVPEKYELKLPEESLLKPEKVAEIEAYAKSKNLSNDQAQELVNREDGLLKSYQTEQINRHNEVVEQWKNQSMADKEFGGERFGESVELARRGMERYFPELKDAFDRVGYGNHPDVIRGFWRIGKAMADDKMVRPQSHGVPAEPSLAERIYGKK